MSLHVDRIIRMIPSEPDELAVGTSSQNSPQHKLRISAVGRLLKLNDLANELEFAI